MKKNILSLVAIMAFSIVTKANTIEVKVIDENEEEFISIDCDKVARAVWWAWWGNGADADTADKKSSEARKDCEDENKKNTEKKSVGIYAN